LTEDFIDPQIYFPSVAAKLVKNKYRRNRGVYKSLTVKNSVRNSMESSTLSKNKRTPGNSRLEEAVTDRDAEGSMLDDDVIGGPIDMKIFNMLDREDGFTLEKLEVPKENALEIHNLV
jgi:hypothetical protein